MELEKHIGKTVLLNVQPEFVQENQTLLQSAPDAHLLYGKVTAVDELGVWVENPSWKTQSVGSQDTISYRMNLLIPWRCLISVGTFPDRKFPTDEAIRERNTTTIGFISK